ncbi:TadE/TadG family type IV pilus assembly protein [Actinomycetota bacterium]
MKRPGSFRLLFWAKEGQATLEFVLLVPLIIMVILVVSQSGQMVYRKNILQQAAREGVRVVSTTNSNNMAIQAVIKVCGSKNNIIPDIKIQPDNESERKLGDIVTVGLIDTNEYGALWSIISATMGKKILLKADSSMRMECQ